LGRCEPIYNVVLGWKSYCSCEEVCWRWDLRSTGCRCIEAFLLL